MKIKYLIAVVLASFGLAVSASAEQVGRWYAGFGQGVLEYGYTVNESNNFSIYCDTGGALDGAVGISVMINGNGPTKNSIVEFRVGDDDYEMYADAEKNLRTDSHVAAVNFVDLWRSLRTGKLLRVSFSDGRKLAIPLNGSAKVLDKEACVPSFNR